MSLLRTLFKLDTEVLALQKDLIKYVPGDLSVVVVCFVCDGLSTSFNKVIIDDKRKRRKSNEHEKSEIILLNTNESFELLLTMIEKNGVYQSKNGKLSVTLCKTYDQSDSTFEELGSISLHVHEIIASYYKSISRNGASKIDYDFILLNASQEEIGVIHAKISFTRVPSTEFDLLNQIHVSPKSTSPHYPPSLSTSETKIDIDLTHMAGILNNLRRKICHCEAREEELKGQLDIAHTRIITILEHEKDLDKELLEATVALSAAQEQIKYLSEELMATHRSSCTTQTRMNDSNNVTAQDSYESSSSKKNLPRIKNNHNNNLMIKYNKVYKHPQPQSTSTPFSAFLSSILCFSGGNSNDFESLEEGPYIEDIGPDLITPETSNHLLLNQGNNNDITTTTECTTMQDSYVSIPQNNTTNLILYKNENFQICHQSIQTDFESESYEKLSDNEYQTYTSDIDDSSLPSVTQENSISNSQHLLIHTDTEIGSSVYSSHANISTEYHPTPSAMTMMLEKLSNIDQEQADISACQNTLSKLQNILFESPKPGFPIQKPPSISSSTIAITDFDKAKERKVIISLQTKVRQLQSELLKYKSENKIYRFDDNKQGIKTLDISKSKYRKDILLTNVQLISKDNIDQSVNEFGNSMSSQAVENTLVIEPYQSSQNQTNLSQNRTNLPQEWEENAMNMNRDIYSNESEYISEISLTQNTDELQLQVELQQNQSLCTSLQLELVKVKKRLADQTIELMNLREELSNLKICNRKLQESKITFDVTLESERQARTEILNLRRQCGMQTKQVQELQEKEHITALEILTIIAENETLKAENIFLMEEKSVARKCLMDCTQSILSESRNFVPYNDKLTCCDQSTDKVGSDEIYKNDWNDVIDCFRDLIDYCNGLSAKLQESELDRYDLNRKYHILNDHNNFMNENKEAELDTHSMSLSQKNSQKKKNEIEIYQSEILELQKKLLDYENNLAEKETILGRLETEIHSIQMSHLHTLESQKTIHEDTLRVLTNEWLVREQSLLSQLQVISDEKMQVTERLLQIESKSMELTGLLECRLKESESACTLLRSELKGAKAEVDAKNKIISHQYKKMDWEILQLREDLDIRMKEKRQLANELAELQLLYERNKSENENHIKDVEDLNIRLKLEIDTLLMRLHSREEEEVNESITFERLDLKELVIQTAFTTTNTTTTNTTAAAVTAAATMGFPGITPFSPFGSRDYYLEGTDLSALQSPVSAFKSPFSMSRSPRFDQRSADDFQFMNPNIIHQLQVQLSQLKQLNITYGSQPTQDIYEQILKITTCMEELLDMQSIEDQPQDNNNNNINVNFLSRSNDLSNFQYEKDLITIERDQLLVKVNNQTHQIQILLEERATLYDNHSAEPSSGVDQEILKKGTIQLNMLGNNTKAIESLEYDSQTSLLSGIEKTIGCNKSRGGDDHLFESWTSSKVSVDTTQENIIP